MSQPAAACCCNRGCRAGRGFDGLRSVRLSGTSLCMTDTMTAPAQDLGETMLEMGRRARAASRALGRMTPADRTRGLMAVAFSSYSCGQLAASLSAGMWRKRYRVLAAIPPRELRRVYRNPLISSGDGSPLFQHGTGDMVNTGTIVSYLGERDADRYACEGYWLRGSTAARHGRGDF